MGTKQLLNEKQLELYDLMGDISQDCYCAGWYLGNEYHIWRALKSGDFRYGRGEMDLSKLERCRTLAEEIDGWILWSNGEPCFVPMGTWIEKLKEEK